MPKKKTNEEFISEVKNLTGDEFTLLDFYKGNALKVKMLHSICNNVFEIRPKDFIKGVRCSHCSTNRKITIDDVKILVNQESECTLISDQIKNSSSKINLKCSCGNEFATTFRSFKHDNKRQCNDCGNKQRGLSQRHSFDYVKETIEANGFKLLSDSYSTNYKPLDVLCPSGHRFQISFNDYIGGHRCRHCWYGDLGERQKISFGEVAMVFESEGYSLLSEAYNSSKDKLKLKCPKNHIIQMSFSDFQYGGNRCNSCYLEEKKANATSHIFNYMRTFIGEWKLNSMKQCEFRCVVTKERFDVIHHLYSFNLIAKEALKNVNLDIRESISDYSIEELDLVINECRKLHNQYGLGVCLTDKIHRLFHSNYGFNNTKEQFEEFHERFKNNEFLL